MKKVVVTENIHTDGIALLEARDDISLTLLDGTDQAQIAAETRVRHACDGGRY